MKRKLTIIALFTCIQLFSFAQTAKEVTSTIKTVTVYKQGAQIEREAKIGLPSGKTEIKLTGLSSFINKESIRISGDGSYKILNVQHQNDFINELEINEDILTLDEKIKGLKNQVAEEEIRIKIAEEKLDFLRANKDIIGRGDSVNPEIFKSVNSIYGEQIENLTMEIFKKQRRIHGYNEEIKTLKNQMTMLNNKPHLPSGTILVTIESGATRASQIKFDYLVSNATWKPSYDMRFNSVDQPLSITYKANIQQNTGIDWKDVNLVLSTAKTDISAQIPELNAYYLQFYYPALAKASNSYFEKGLQGRVAGIQVQSSGRPGNDLDLKIRGLASLKNVPDPLYVVDGIAIEDISSINPNDVINIEVVKDANATAIYGSKGANGVILITTRKDPNSSAVPLTILSKRETSNEFIVSSKQTINANLKWNLVSYREQNIEADFEYQSVPKISENVFLVGKIIDWHEAELIDGEINVYLENSFVGKSMLNTQQFSDTLEISFGIDNNINIKREQLSEYSTTKFIGNNIKTTLAHKLIVRNNKSYGITTRILDQLPISTTKDIQVESLEISGGKLNEDSGEIIWDIDLKPNENKELIIKYEVKYPNDKKVIIE